MKCAKRQASPPRLSGREAVEDGPPRPARRHLQTLGQACPRSVWVQRLRGSPLRLDAEPGGARWPQGRKYFRLWGNGSTSRARQPTSTRVEEMDILQTAQFTTEWQVALASTCLSNSSYTRELRRNAAPVVDQYIGRFKSINTGCDIASHCSSCSFIYHCQACTND